MKTWLRRWVITVYWDQPANSPYGQDQRAFRVGVRQLGKLVRAARADPHVIAFPFKPRWELVGDDPEQCPAGHPFGGGSASRPQIAWYECPGCPGHLVYRCRLGCAELLDPPPGRDCRPRPPAPGLEL